MGKVQQPEASQEMDLSVGDGNAEATSVTRVKFARNKDTGDERDAEGPWRGTFRVATCTIK